MVLFKKNRVFYLNGKVKTMCQTFVKTNVLGEEGGGRAVELFWILYPTQNTKLF